MDGDIAEVMVACTEGWLDATNFGAYSLYSATVVAAAGGYPGPYVRGDTIELTAPPADTLIFHAGTKGPTLTQTQTDGKPALQPLYNNGQAAVPPLQNDGQKPLQPLHTHGIHIHSSHNFGSSKVLTTSGGG